MQISVSFKDQILARYANQLGALGQGKAEKAIGRALAHTGTKARTAVRRALVGQTGLKAGVINRAVKSMRGDAGAMSYVLRTEGGNVRLKFFGARETKEGVSAAPWNSRRVYAGTFKRAGWWPNRVNMPHWNGQVFRIAGGRTKTGKQKFESVRSDLYIPDEMVTGETLAAFNGVINNDLVPRVAREVARLLPG